MARDEGEVLLPGPAFDKFDDFFKRLDEAHNQYQAGRMLAELTGHNLVSETGTKVLHLLHKADELRPEVVAAFRATIEGPLPR